RAPKRSAARAVAGGPTWRRPAAPTAPRPTLRCRRSKRPWLAPDRSKGRGISGGWGAHIGKCFGHAIDEPSRLAGPALCVARARSFALFVWLALHPPDRPHHRSRRAGDDLRVGPGDRRKVRAAVHDD